MNQGVTQLLAKGWRAVCESALLKLANTPIFTEVEVAAVGLEDAYRDLLKLASAANAVDVNSATKLLEQSVRRFQNASQAITPQSLGKALKSEGKGAMATLREFPQKYESPTDLFTLTSEAQLEAPMGKGDRVQGIFKEVLNTKLRDPLLNHLRLDLTTLPPPSVHVYMRQYALVQLGVGQIPVQRKIAALLEEEAVALGRKIRSLDPNTLA